MNDIKEKISSRKVLVVIPTYNNEKTITSVIEQVKQYSDDILVVNDGSTDNTQTLINKTGVENISYFPNKGKGYAIRQSFKFARDNSYDYILTIDSDGQHYASDIPAFIDQIDDNNNPLIIGSRNLQADNMPQKNTFANKFSNFWFKVETGNTLSDTQSGFRLYPIKKVASKKYLSNRYEFEVEVIVRAAWDGVNVYNIPIKVFYPTKEERVSHFKPFKDFTRISILNTFLVLISLLYYYPCCFFRLMTKDNIKRFIKKNITHTSDSNNKIAASIGLGIFFGILPIWGYQMIAATFIAHILKLNKVLTLISANISLPPIIPFIIYGSFYMGALLLGLDTNVDLSNISFASLSHDMLQYIIGAVVLAIVSGGAVYALSLIILLLIRHKING